MDFFIFVHQMIFETNVLPQSIFFCLTLSFSVLQLINNKNTLCLTSVALSVWFLMLIKACNSPSKPRLTGDSHSVFTEVHGSTVLLCICLLLRGLLLVGCGPKRLSRSVSLSLDSLDNISAFLETLVVRMLEQEGE